MPEVPLWDMKIDGEPLPPPDEEAPLPERRALTPDEEAHVERPREAADASTWYVKRRKEFEDFELTPRSVSLRKSVEVFLAHPGDLDTFLAQNQVSDGLEAWCVLRSIVDKCNDRSIVDALIAKLWQKAVPWALHARHREITMKELNDLWESFRGPELDGDR